jgi:hypothetical protein
MTDGSKTSSHAHPALVRRAVIVWLSLVFTFLVATLTSALLWHPLGLPNNGPYKLVLFVLGFAPLVFGLPIWLWRVRRLRRLLFETGFRVCTHCAYDVSRLELSGKCPECGHTYDVTIDVQRWAKVGAPYTEPRPTGFKPWSPEDGVGKGVT